MNNTFTFLMADDSASKRHLLKSVLLYAEWPGVLLEATNTDDTKKHIDDHPEIVAAFIDYEMPRENGPEVVRYLREKIPACKIAVVSASDSNEYRKSATDAGADTYVCSSHADVDDVLEDLLSDWLHSLRTS